MYFRNAIVIASMSLVFAGFPLSAQIPDASSRRPYTITIPCCRCIDGKSTEIRIDTPKAGNAATVPWSVKSPGSSATVLATPVVNPNSAWTALSPAGWISPSGEQIGDYVYQLQIVVPRCVIPASIRVSGSFAADNGAKVYIDNSSNPIAVSGGTPDYGFKPSAITSFGASIPFTPNGVHVLKVVVHNSGGATGLILAGMITVTCSKDLEMPTKYSVTVPRNDR